VWVADQDELFRSSVAQALRRGGARVVELASGPELGTSPSGAEPDLIVLATDREELDGSQMYARLKSTTTGKQSPLVVVIHKRRSVDDIVNSVGGFLADWNRLCVRNLAGVLALLQVRQASGQFEVEAFGSRGTILLRDGQVLTARWRSLKGREVLKFLAENLPNVGFRFAERLKQAPETALESERKLPAGREPEREASRRRFWLEQARRALFDPHGLDKAFLSLRIAEGDGASAEVSPGELQFLLGLAHLRSGDMAVAADELRTASDALPGDPRVTAALEEALRRLDGMRAAAQVPAAAAQVPAAAAQVPAAAVSSTNDGLPAPSPPPATAPPPALVASIESASQPVADTDSIPTRRSRPPHRPFRSPVVSRALSRRRQWPALYRSVPAASEPILDEATPTSPSSASAVTTHPILEGQAPASPADPWARLWESDVTLLPPLRAFPSAPAPRPRRPFRRAVRWVEDAAGPLCLAAVLTALAWGPLGRAIGTFLRAERRARVVAIPQITSAVSGGVNARSGPLEVLQFSTDTTTSERSAELRILVNAEGRAEEVDVLRSSGDSALDQRAVEAIRRVSYAPGRRERAPASVWIHRSVVFPRP
jgi:TonB family protein